MPGGALAVKRPYRMALGYLLGAEALGAAGPGPRARGERRRDGAALRPRDGVPRTRCPFLARLDPREVAVVRTQVARRLNAPLASSAGRLFDAAAAACSACATWPSTRHRRRSTWRSRPATAAAAPLPYARRPGGRAPRATTRGRPCAPSSRASGRPGGAGAGPLAAAFHETIAEVDARARGRGARGDRACGPSACRAASSRTAGSPRRCSGGSPGTASRSSSTARSRSTTAGSAMVRRPSPPRGWRPWRPPGPAPRHGAGPVRHD